MLIFLITDLHLGGAPLVVHALARGLKNPPAPSTSSFALSAGHSSLSPQPSVLSTRYSYNPRVISLAPLPASGSVAQLLQNDQIPTYSLNAQCPADFPAALTRLIRLLKKFQNEPAPIPQDSSLKTQDSLPVPESSALSTQHSALPPPPSPLTIYSILIHANALAAAARPFIPNARWIQSLHTVQPNPRWHWYLQGFISQFADAFIAPSPVIIQKTQRFGPVPNPQVIPNGVDIPRFANALPWDRASLGLPPNAPILGTIGRFDPIKRLHLLIGALGKLHAVKSAAHGTAGAPLERGGSLPELVLVGYGPQENALRRLAHFMGIAPHVHFPGPTSMPERWYKTFNLFLLPSAAEGFPMSILEAMAAKTPIIASNIPALRVPLVHGRSAWLVSNPTPESLAHAIQILMENPTRAEALSNQAFAVVSDHFSLAEMVNRHDEFLKKM